MGHIDSPYVYFKAPVDIATNLTITYGMQQKRLRLYGYRRRELEQSMINLAQEIKTTSKILKS